MMQSQKRITDYLFFLIISLLLLNTSVIAQEIREYIVKRTVSSLNIDGRLDESDWQAAPLTERFVIYYDGSETVLSTQSKFLWDEYYLYIGFICEDPDVWATMVNRDDHLWEGEVVEILCDPNGDGLDYFEIQVNPLGTILDLLMTKAYYLGGTSNLSWNLDSIKAGVWIDGTLNDYESGDSLWTCEVALPFTELAFMAPDQNFPPVSGDEWRILTTRYDYPRNGSEVLEPEISCWNQTQSNGGFHVPTKFGRIIYSSETVVSLEDNLRHHIPENQILLKNYPNPFNPSTRVYFSLSTKSPVKIDIFDILGRHVQTLTEKTYAAGAHEIIWNGNDKYGNSLSGGIYMLRFAIPGMLKTKKMLLRK